MTHSLSGLTGRLIGRYSIERELGRGGAAIVYLGRAGIGADQVAIKVLRPELAEGFSAEQFLREIRRTSTLVHPRIAPIIDSGSDDGQLFCVLPYMEGGTLRTRIEREKQLRLEEVVALGRAMCEALEFAHTKGLVHRDVKPENILYSRGEAKLADFGIAKAMERASGESTTSTGLVRGTPAYMSPEQASGDHELDGRSDIYSLACVLYEAIAGVRAFIGATPQQIVAQRLSHPPRPLHVYRPSVPEELEEVLDKAFAMAPADRYPTAKAFGDALAEIEPILAQPGKATRERRAAEKRSRAVKWTVGVTVAGLVTALVWIATAAIRARTDDRALAVVDTTRIAVFGLSTSGAIGIADPNLSLRKALLRWSGIELPDLSVVRDASGSRKASVPSTSEARRTAIRLRAGRFVLGELNGGPGEGRLHAMLFDVAHPGSPIAEASSDILAGGSDAAFAAIADHLLLRSRDSSELPIAASGTKSLPAAQAYLRGKSELTEWNLAAADSAFATAGRFDRTYAAPALWLALTRLWSGGPQPTWSFSVEAAAANRSQLSEHDRVMVDALAALAANDRPRACTNWQRLVQRDSFDFAAWYGSANCLEKDNAVLADSRSPTGWRFRTSMRQALVRYRRAFALRPAVLAALRDNQFSRIRRIFWTSHTELRRGQSVSKPARVFVAAPSLQGDTLGFLPVPAELVSSLDSRSAQLYSRAGAAAVAHQRAEFRDVALAWAAASPTDATAHEAVALSLSLLGDPSALDTIARAITLAREPLEHFRLSTTAVWLRIRFGVPNDLALVQSARRLADSLILTLPQKVADHSGFATVAALTGHALLAAQLERDAPGPPQTFVASPIIAARLARQMLIFAAMGGPVDSMRALEARVDSLITQLVPPKERGRVRAELLGRAASVAFPEFAFAALPSLDFSTFPLLGAEAAWLRADTAAALARLDAIKARLGLTDMAARSFDVAFPEAWLRAATGDIKGAADWLDLPLMSLRTSAPLIDPVPAATMVRAMALRASLAANSGDSSTARRWATIVVELWSGGDAAVQPTVQRMKQLMKSQ